MLKSFKLLSLFSGLVSAAIYAISFLGFVFLFLPNILPRLSAWPSVFVFLSVFLYVFFFAALMAIFLDFIFKRLSGDRIWPLGVFLLSSGIFLPLFYENSRRQLLVFLFYAFLIFLCVSLSFANSLGLQPDQKRARRIRVIGYAASVFGITASVFGFVLFFGSPSFPLTSLLIGVVMGFTAWLVWLEYVELPFVRALPWVLTAVVIMTEISWSFFLLPLGYFISALVVTWVWYILQLLIRFHFSRTGIIWKKQLWFLGLNFVFLTLFFIFYVRWV